MTWYCFSFRQALLGCIFVGGIAIFSISCGPSPGNAPGQEGKTWVARYGNHAVDAQEFQAYLDQQTRRNPRLQMAPATKRALLEKFLERKLLLAEAERQRLDFEPDVMKHLQEMKEQVLVEHLFSHKEKELAGQIRIGEEEIRSYHKTMGQAVQFQYLSLADADQAKVVMEGWTEKGAPANLIDSGKVSFATLNETWKKEILELPLQKPQIVKIGAQWVVVKVINRREEAGLPLEQVREQIVRELTDRKGKEMLQNWVNSLKGQNRLEINEAYNWH
jgi:hypothetical protein